MKIYFKAIPINEMPAKGGIKTADVDLKEAAKIQDDGPIVGFKGKLKKVQKKRKELNAKV